MITARFLAQACGQVLVCTLFLSLWLSRSDQYQWSFGLFFGILMIALLPTMLVSSVLGEDSKLKSTIPASWLTFRAFVVGILAQITLIILFVVAMWLLGSLSLSPILSLTLAVLAGVIPSSLLLAKLGI